MTKYNFNNYSKISLNSSYNIIASQHNMVIQVQQPGSHSQNVGNIAEQQDQVVSVRYGIRKTKKVWIFVLKIVF